MPDSDTPSDAGEQAVASFFHCQRNARKRAKHNPGVEKIAQAIRERVAREK